MKNQSLRVLMVENSEDDVLLIILALKKGGYNPVYERIETAAAMKKALKKKPWDIILCDYRMPNFSAPSAIALLKETNIDIPIIVVTGVVGEETAAECMRLGAQDYIMKYNLSRLCPAISRELEEAEVRNKQKQTEEALHQSEELFKLLFNTINDVVVFHYGLGPDGLPGKFIEVNDIACKRLGYSRDEFLRMSPLDIDDPDTVKEMSSIIEKLNKEGQAIWEGVHITKDGQRIPVEINNLVINFNGTPAIIATARDITERKRMEKKLRNEEQLFRALAEQSSDIIILINKEFKVTYVNLAAEIFLGLKHEEVIGSDMYNYLHPDDFMLVVDIFSKFFKDAGVNVQRAEIRISNKDGTWHTVEATGTNLIHDNVVESVIVNLHDITERKKAEDLVRKSEEKYRLLADHMKDQVWLMDMNMNITYASPSVEILTGYSSDEIKKLKLEELLTPESLQKATDFISINMPKAIKSSSKDFLFRTLELEFILKGGQTIWGECSFNFIRDENGKPSFILGEGRDVTQRKQMEYELRASESNFRHSFDNSPLGVRISTLEGETIYANKAILDMYGYDSIEELKNKRIKERYTPESYAEWKERKKKRLAGESGTSEYEISIIKKNGEIRHLHVLRKEIFWDGKKQSQVIYQDITEHRQAEEKLRKTLESLRQSIGTTIQVLGMAVEARDPYTAGHHKRVSHLARFIAKDMGLSHDIVEGIRMAGSIHDIGKLSVPSEILSKPTKLTDLEFSLIKEHSLAGYEMLKNVESPWPLAEIVLQHHERVNGTGYPRNMKADDIIMAARIMAVADVVEAMSSHRPYRPSLGIEAALAEIEKNKGVLYDEDVVDACLRLFREKGYQLISV